MFGIADVRVMVAELRNDVDVNAGDFPPERRGRIVPAALQIVEDG